MGLVGQVIPTKFDPGLLTLSFLVSLVGAVSTLELINRRTSRKGYYNNLLLFAAAVTMGGVAIWCMHYIGNRATIFLDGQPELQIVYSVRVTVASFFVPILVLLAAFFVVTHNVSGVSWWRIVVSGLLSGGAICGMHYLGNASVSNYICAYNAAFVAGSVVIAVAASTIALALFFVFRASWSNSWWKRLGCAVVLAGAVSGMHWCGAVGTTYRIIHVHSRGGDVSQRNITVIVISCLSVAACVIMAGTAVYSAKVRQAYASKASRITLAAAVFDSQGRILVTTDGLLPSEEITDKFLQKDESFSTAHPLFHWVFQASRNWSSVTVLLNKMRNHLADLPHHSRNVRTGISLVDDDGLVIDNYDIIFRELFCLAAAGLAEKMNEDLIDAGILWDEILATGGPQDSVSMRSNSTGKTPVPTVHQDTEDMVEKGIRFHQPNHGSLMCLVRTVDNSRIVDRLEAAGYVFAEPHQVAHIISTKMQIRTTRLEEKLASMRNYVRGSMLDPRVHVGLFAVRTQVDHHGFDVLVRKQARNLLPSVELPLDRLDPVHLEFLQRLDGLTVHSILQQLQRVQDLPPRNASFAALLYDAIQDLRAEINENIFEDAKLISKIAEVPCRSHDGPRHRTCSLITFSIMIPIHVRVRQPNYQFVPLYFFKAQQMVYENSPHAAAFARSVHRELSPVLNSVPALPRNRPPSLRLSSLLPEKLMSKLRLGSNSVDAWSTKTPKLTSSSRECMALTPSNASVASIQMYRGGSSVNGGDRDPDGHSSDSAADAKEGPVFSSRQLHHLGQDYPKSSPASRKAQRQQTKSLGGMGIMISSEVTVAVDVEENRKRSSTLVGNNGLPPVPLGVSRSRSVRQHALKTDADGMPLPASTAPPIRRGVYARDIELGDVTSVLNGGYQVGVSTARVEVKKDGDVQDTFVDELFAGCLALGKY
ncbi:hypothetical protein QBC35DRAFT_390119 [Podospora australis]|uniref:MHYT domain-containing protein n=1 Tax=Podospora australis TaxID=1536484 RepID=A0AAN7AGP9_9PEZI|nr:hypothetical protein QBC35DRAFT_390119 [Podospora australis]